MMQSCQTIEAVYLLQPRRPAHDKKLSEGKRSEQQARELPSSEQDARPGACVQPVHPARDAYRRMSCSQPDKRAEAGRPRADEG